MKYDGSRKVWDSIVNIASSFGSLAFLMEAHEGGLCAHTMGRANNDLKRAYHNLTIRETSDCSAVTQSSFYNMEQSLHYIRSSKGSYIEKRRIRCFSACGTGQLLSCPIAIRHTCKNLHLRLSCASGDHLLEKTNLNRKVGYVAQDHNHDHSHQPHHQATNYQAWQAP
jgi:hypothetical protein